MKAYEVRLSKTMSQKVFATVQVEAENSEQAGAEALKRAQLGQAEFASRLEVPLDPGTPEILEIEAIVDLDD